MSKSILDAKETMRQQAAAESGTATLTAVLIVALLSVFVAASVSRVTTSATMANNDYANSQAFYAAQASLENMTRNFNNIFTTHLTPTTSDLSNVETTLPTSTDFPGFTFSQTVSDTNPKGGSDLPAPYLVQTGPFAGLTSYRASWQLDATATSVNQSQVHLTRQFYSHEIPIFQFGIFYNGPLTIHPGPQMWFNGRVHTNDNLYVMCGNSVSFTSVVTAAGEIIRDWNRNGETLSSGSWTGSVYITNPTGTPVALPMATPNTYYGSVEPNTGSTSGSSANPEPGMTPNNDKNYDAWNTEAANFGGNLQAHTAQLQLPLQLGPNKSPIELIKRQLNSADYQVATLGQTADDPITSQSRYANKPGIRISLSDSQLELPGGTGGVRLDGDKLGANAANTDANGMRGYIPQQMIAANGQTAYQATRVNGFRLFTGANYPNNGTAGTGSQIPANRQTWIKVELVNVNSSTAAVTTTDVTADFLSLGVTYQNSSGFNIGDSRAIICMQRYEMMGAPVKVSGAPAGALNTVNVPTTLNGSDPTITAGTTKYYGLATSVGVPMVGLSPSPTTFPTTTASPTSTIKGGKASPTTTQTATQAPTTTNVPYNMIYPLPVHTYYLPSSGGSGINYVTTGNYSPSMNMTYTTLSPTIYNAAGTATTLNYYPGYTSAVVFATPTPTPVLNGTPSALGNALNSIEATEFAGGYATSGSLLGWSPTPNPTPGVTATLPSGGGSVQVLPFPIEFFDTREGVFNCNTTTNSSGGAATATAPVWDSSSTSNGMYPLGNVPKAGIMSGIDLNMSNMTKFLSGTWDGCFPNGLTSTQVPINPGWIIYVSDRRGDRDDDGNYDMEDIYGPMDGVMQPAEDYLGSGASTPIADVNWEAAPFYVNSGGTTIVYPAASAATATGGDPAYLASVPTDIGAFFDHQYFRRGVRLINGSQLPGGNTLSSGQVVGFTVTAENPIYIIGNYNSTGVNSEPTGTNVPPTAVSGFLPNYASETSPSLEVPASVVGDAIYILSNAWLDANSFRNPLVMNESGTPNGTRTATTTTVRAAFFTGLTQGSLTATPNQGGGDADLDGGVHNFPRMLENWGGTNVYMNYCGSLVNMFPSRQAVGAHKNGGYPTVYSPPFRNWTFDSAFLTLNELPPGTPLFQFDQMTGFSETTTQQQ